MLKENHIKYKYTGFLLIELLIAIGIFASFSVLIAGFHRQIIERQRDILTYTSAIYLAGTIMDEISINPNQYLSSFKHDNFTILISPINKNQENIKTNSKVFQHNNIIISWKTINGKKQKISFNFGTII